MARAPFKHPSVFVGCPYAPQRKLDQFKQALERLPIEFVYADSAIRTQHVMERIRRGITRTDYSLFDITGWNPNVTLEVGLAEGLNKDYYILFRPGRGSRAEAPADLKGVQRFQYKRLEGLSSDSLTAQLLDHLVRKLTHPRNIYDEFSGQDREKQFVVAMRILAHFKKAQILRREDLAKLTRGTWLRKDSIEEVIESLRKRGLVKGRLDSQKWKCGRNLYQQVKV